MTTVFTHLFDAVWRDVLAFLIGAGLSWFVGLRRAWHRHEQTQEVIADRLDTQTTGGLRDVVRSNEQLYRAYKQASPGQGK